jgi:CRISPR-associated protein Cas2
MMVVITMTNCPPKLRGDLSRWLIEIDTGVFVGNINARVREHVWKRVCDNIKNGRASMAFGTNSEQKLDFKVHNTEWEPVDFDGIKLIRRNFENEDDDYYKKWSKPSLNHKNRVAQMKKTSDIAEKYAVIDIETTGLKESDSIIEIAAIIVEKGEIADTFTSLIKSDVSIPTEIVKLTGITENLIQQEGIPIKKALGRFLDFCKELTLVGHNVGFDIGFLQKACADNGYPAIKNKSVDTMRLSRKKIDDISGYGLKAVSEYFGIECETAHRAYDDCVTAYRIYEKLKEIE